MFNQLFTHLSNSLFNKKQPSPIAPVIEQKDAERADDDSRIIFVDLDNVIGNKNTKKGQNLLDNLNIFFEDIASRFFHGEKVEFVLYANQAYLNINEAALNKTIRLVDTPYQKYKGSTQADQIIMADVLFASHSQHKLAIFTNDKDFAPILRHLTSLNKEVTLITNSHCNSTLINACSRVVDGRKSMLAAGLKAVDMIAEQFSEYSKLNKPIPYNRALSYCRLFSVYEWQGFGSFQALLEAALGKSCMLKGNQITLLDAPLFELDEYKVIFNALAKCNAADIEQSASQLVTLCNKHKLHVSLMQARHFVQKLLPFIGHTQAKKIAKHYFNWARNAARVSLHQLPEQQLPILRQVIAA